MFTSAEKAILIRRIAVSFVPLALLALMAGAAWCLPGGPPDPEISTQAPGTPHPTFVGLPGGEALDLGRYECEARVPEMRCKSVFDYSRINYDPYNHRILVFGGGHAATGRTDIDSFDLQSLAWRGLYPSMSCDEVAKGDIDPRGFHNQTGHPVARHTYDQNVVARIDGQGWLLMFSTEGFRGKCHGYNAKIRGVAAFPLWGDKPLWSFSEESAVPWGYAGSAEFDPVSGMIILFGGQSRGMWVYDPGQKRIVASVRRFERAKNSSNLLYDPRGDRMLLIESGSLQVRAYDLDRANWQQTREVMIEAKGEKPEPLRNFAYDSRNHVIGGIRDGVFHAFDLESHTWSSHPVKVRSPSGAQIGTVRHHAIDYDPINNVFILVAESSTGLRTWAYRFRE